MAGGNLPRVAQVTKWVDTAVARRATRHSGHRAEKREQIVRAAIETIEEHGVDVGTGQIAERAGLARPHVYRHFDSKDDLDDAVARAAADALVEAVRPSLSRSGTAPQVIRGVVAASVRWAHEHPNLYRFMAARRQSRALQDARAGETRFLAEVVAAAAAYLRATDTEVEPPAGVLAGLMGMVDASIIWWLEHRDERQKHLVDRLARQVWLVIGDMMRELGVQLDEDTRLVVPRKRGPLSEG